MADMYSCCSISPSVRIFIDGNQFPFGEDFWMFRDSMKIECSLPGTRRQRSRASIKITNIWCASLSPYSLSSGGPWWRHLLDWVRILPPPHLSGSVIAAGNDVNVSIAIHVASHSSASICRVSCSTQTASSGRLNVLPNHRRSFGAFRDAEIVDTVVVEVCNRVEVCSPPDWNFQCTHFT